jgi:chemotaxis protein methyltransferase CheR
VTFGRLNLLADPFPGGRSGVREADLILCRNVFIYFARPAVPAVLQKFADSLCEGGYLMTGHTEIHAEELGQLQPRIFPGSVVYQRVVAEAPAHRSMLSPVRKTAGAAGSGPPTRSRSDVETLRPAIERSADRSPAPALYERARTLADVGRHAEAADTCRQAIADDPMAVGPYRLLAQIAEEQGEFGTARECLKKVIYLAPTLAAAYLDLAALYQRGGDGTRARRMRVAARAVLEAADPAEPAGAVGEPTAGELLAQLQALTRGEN